MKTLLPETLMPSSHGRVILSITYGQPAVRHTGKLSLFPVLKGNLAWDLAAMRVLVMTISLPPMLITHAMGLRTFISRMVMFLGVHVSAMLVHSGRFRRQQSSWDTSLTARRTSACLPDCCLPTTGLRGLR